MAQEYNEVMENLFQAIDVIAQQKVDSLNFNKTIRCCITDDSKAELGEYTVTDGSSTFVVYSDNTTYAEGTYVYVLIPNGDFTMQKTIIGKYINGTNEYYTYRKPSDFLVDITGNLFTNFTSTSLAPMTTADFNKYPNNGTVFASLAANGAIKTKVVWTSEELFINTYDRLLVSADFRTWLRDYDLYAGSYGLRVDFIISNNTTTQTENKIRYASYYLDSKDMSGDIYDFDTFYTQEALIDLTTIYSPETEYIKQIQYVFYQQGDFIDRKHQPIDSKDTFNIFIANLKACFGFDVNQFSQDTVLLYTLDTNYYATFFTEDAKKRFGITDNMTTATINELLSQYNEKNLQVRWIHFLEDDEENDDAIILDKHKLVVYSNSVSMPTNAKLHWYYYQLTEGIYDDLAGAFWSPIENYENKFDVGQYIPDITKPKEQLKAIVEYPCRSYLEKQLKQDSLYQQICLARQVYIDDPIIYGEILLKQLEASLEKTDYYNDILSNIQSYDEIVGQIQNDLSAKEAEYFGQLKYYESDILELINESLVPDPSTVDLIKGLEIEVDPEGYHGVYRVYNDTGNIISSAESTAKRTLTAKYTSLVTGESELDTAERIQWIFPLSNTMIFPPEDGVEYDSAQDLVYEEDGFLFITRYGVISSHSPGDEELDSTQQIFRIKEYYSQSYTNNFIRCRLTKNNIVYEASAELTFGPSGTNGTDYTFNLSFEHKENALTVGESIVVIPTLYNYENNDISDQIQNIEYTWESQNDNGGIRMNIIDGIAAELTASNIIENCEHYILKATIRNIEISTGSDQIPRQVTLTAYLPIPVRASREYIGFDGADKIIYDATGTLRDYYMDPYAIYVYNVNKTEKKQNVQWSMSYGSDTDAYGDGAKYYPQVSPNGELTPCSLFLQDNGKQISVRGYFDGQCIWVQPIRIYQYVYTSALINSWDGSLTIDEENGIMLSTMIGAGYKDDQNRFNGVMMGDVAATADGMADGIGIYGYNEGIQSFGWLIDGTGFIGKKGKGQILFDGNDGTIQSANYFENDNGMCINLNEGILTAKHGDGLVYIDPTGGSGEHSPGDAYFQIDSVDGNTLMCVGDDEFFLQTNDFYEDFSDPDNSKGTRIDLQEGRISSYNFGLRTKHMEIDSEGDPLFKIWADNENKPIINMEYDSEEKETTEFYLQSDNFVTQTDDTPGAGVRLDLKNGYLEGYDFKLYIGVNDKENFEREIVDKDGNITTKTITKTGLEGSYFVIDSNITSDKDEFFCIHWVKTDSTTITVIEEGMEGDDDADGSSSVEIEESSSADLIKITPSKFWMNSPDFTNKDGKRQGMRLDFSVHNLIMFHADQYKAVMTGANSAYGFYIRDYEEDKASIAMRWDGRLVAKGLILPKGDDPSQRGNVFYSKPQIVKQFIKDASVSGTTLTITIDNDKIGVMPIKKADEYSYSHPVIKSKPNFNEDDMFLFLNHSS